MRAVLGSETDSGSPWALNVSHIYSNTAPEGAGGSGKRGRLRTRGRVAGHSIPGSGRLRAPGADTAMSASAVLARKAGSTAGKTPPSVCFTIRQGRFDLRLKIRAPLGMPWAPAHLLASEHPEPDTHPPSFWKRGCWQTLCFLWLAARLPTHRLPLPLRDCRDQPPKVVAEIMPHPVPFADPRLALTSGF